MKKILLVSLLTMSSAMATAAEKGLAEATSATAWCAAEKSTRVTVAGGFVGGLWLSGRLAPQLADTLDELNADPAKIKKGLLVLAGELETAMSLAMCKGGRVDPVAQDQNPAEVAVLAAALMGWLKAGQ